LATTWYEYASPRVPPAFDGFRILQVSDYHVKDFGDGQAAFLAMVADASPGVILFTGDMVDEDHPGILASAEVAAGCARIAPTYFVTGNHELDRNAKAQYRAFQEVMEREGVVDLDGQKATVTVGGDHINLVGLSYAARYGRLEAPPAAEGEFNVLLYHGSDDFDALAPYGYDLVFSGHGHGGVVRLPFLGGIFDNRGGFFPKYDGGMFRSGASTLVSSRGVGDTYLPRFFNPPEIVVVTLRASA
jgi:predicted MPP superfamily phosphohydrolase